MKISMKSILGGIKIFFIGIMPLFSLIKYFFVITTYLFILYTTIEIRYFLETIFFLNFIYLTFPPLIKIVMLKLSCFKDKKNIAKKIIYSNLAMLFLQVPIFACIIYPIQMLFRGYAETIRYQAYEIDLFGENIINAFLYMFIYIYIASLIDQYFYGKLKKEKFEYNNNILFYSNLGFYILSMIIMMLIQAILYYI